MSNFILYVHLFSVFSCRSMREWGEANDVVSSVLSAFSKDLRIISNLASQLIFNLSDSVSEQTRDRIMKAMVVRLCK